MHAPEATTPSAPILATQRSLRPQQRGGSFNLCNTRMNAPASTTLSASQPVTRLPEQPTRLQQRGNSFNLYGARMHAPAATTSSAYCLATSSTRTHALADTVPTAVGRPFQPLRYSGACPCGHYILGIAPCNPRDSDAGPSGLCVPSSGATASISATLGYMPLRPRHPQHCSLQAA